MTQSNSAERRQHPRVPAAFALHMGDGHQDGEVVSESINVSSSGLYYRSTRPVEEFTRLGLTLVFPGAPGHAASAPVEVRAVVVRCEPSADPAKRTFFDIAVCFTDVSDASRVVLNEFIASRMAH